jgi:hypothetical protein
MPIYMGTIEAMPASAPPTPADRATGDSTKDAN